MSDTPKSQEERWMIRKHGDYQQIEGPDTPELPMYGAAVEVVPAAELEMCQRYFPFMRRSRDEAVKREKALAKTLEQIRFCYAQGVAPGSDWSVVAGFMNALAEVALDQSGKS